MKRLWCLVLAMVMLMSFTAAYADEEVFSAIENTPFSANLHTEVSLKLNKPFNFINELFEPEEMEDMPIDLKQLAESACNIMETADIAYSVDENKKSVKVSAVSQLDMPFEFNDDLKADIWMRTGAWLSADISDADNPGFLLVFKVPLSTDYIVFDYSDLLEDADFDSEMVAEYIKKYTTDEFLKEVWDFIKEEITKNASIEKGENEYIISLDDKGIKNVLKAAADKFYDIVAEAFEVEGIPFEEDTRYGLDQALATLDEFGIVGAEGIKIKIQTEDNYVKVSDISVHIDCNLHDAITAYGVDMSKYNRENWQIDCVLSIKTSVSDINNAEVSEDYELTEENTERVWAPYEYEYNAMYENIYVMSSRPIIPGNSGGVKIALPDAMSGFKISKKYYAVDGDKITITPIEGRYEFSEAVLTVGENNVIVDGEAYTVGDEVEKDGNGVVYIPAEALAVMMGYKVASMTHYFDDKGRPFDEIRFERENPEYKQPEKNYAVPNITVGDEGAPVVINGEMYIPLRATMGEIGIDAEDISCTNGEITVSDSKNRAPEFAEMKLWENSNKVCIDSVEIQLDNQIIEKEGKAYFPMQLLEKMNCKITNIRYSIEYGNYSFTINRGDIVRNNGESYIPYNSPERTLFVEDSGASVTENGEYYLPLFPLMGEFKIRAENIFETDDKVTVVADSPISGFGQIEISGKSIKMDGNQFELQNPMIAKEGKKYLPAEFISSVVGGTVERVSAEYAGGQSVRYRYIITVPNPVYEADVEE